ncbi:MAG: glycosyltransferase [Pseudomonadota bacterium]
MRVLLVAYDFPPVGGVGVQRAVKYARYLPEFGIEPVVLTTAHGRGWLRDDELLARNGLDGLRVLRLGGERLLPYHDRRDGAPFPWRLAPSMMLSTLRHGDLYGLWYESLRRDYPALLQREGIDAVWTTIPKTSAFRFGLDARRRGLPWIADVRDSMVANPDMIVAPGLGQLQGRRLAAIERQVVRHADRVCTVSQAIVDNMVARCGEAFRRRFVLLPNGFDRADFPADAPVPRNDKCSFIFAGTFTGRRRPDVLVAGVNRAVAGGLVDPAALRFDFYGRFEPDIDAVLASLDPRIESRRHGFVPQSQAIAATRRADVVLLVTSEGNHPAAQEIITGKVFECMGLGKRVLALTDAAPLRALLAEARIGDACAAGDPQSVAESIAGLVARYRRGESLAVEPDPAVVARYERRAQAGVLAGLFRDLQGMARVPVRGVE